MSATPLEFTRDQMREALRHARITLESTIPGVVSNRGIKFDAHDMQNLDQSIAAVAEGIMSVQDSVRMKIPLPEDIVANWDAVSAISNAIHAVGIDTRMQPINQRFHREGFMALAENLGINTQVEKRLVEMEAVSTRGL